MPIFGKLPDDAGTVLFQRLEQLSKCSEPGPGVTRFPYTEEHTTAIGVITDWIQRAGLQEGLNAAGTLVG